MEGQCAFCGLSNQMRICKNPDTGKGSSVLFYIAVPRVYREGGEEYEFGGDTHICGKLRKE